MAAKLRTAAAQLPTTVQRPHEDLDVIAAERADRDDGILRTTTTAIGVGAARDHLESPTIVYHVDHGSCQ